MNDYYLLSKKSNDSNIKSKYQNLTQYLNYEDSLNKYYNVCKSYDCDSCDKTINNYDYVFKNCKDLQDKLNNFDNDQDKLYLDQLLNK